MLLFGFWQTIYGIYHEQGLIVGWAELVGKVFESERGIKGGGKMAEVEAQGNGFSSATSTRNRKRPNQQTTSEQERQVFFFSLSEGSLSILCINLQALHNIWAS